MNSDTLVFVIAILANLMTWEALRSACLIAFIGSLVMLFVLILVGSYLSGKQQDAEGEQS